MNRAIVIAVAGLAVSACESLPQSRSVQADALTYSYLGVVPPPAPDRIVREADCTQPTQPEGPNLRCG